MMKLPEMMTLRAAAAAKRCTHQTIAGALRRGKFTTAACRDATGHRTLMIVDDDRFAEWKPRGKPGDPARPSQARGRNRKPAA